MTLELADRSVSKPIDIAKDVSVKVGMFHFPADFVVVDFKPDPRVPLILERCFLKTGHALINVHKGKITLRIGNEAITYNLDQTSRYLANYDQMTANKIDVTDEPCKEYSQEVLGFFNVTASGSPTPSDDPIISTTSPTLTPFGDSDFLLFEEANTFLGLKDDPDSPELDPSYYDPEGDIQMLEAILNSDPAPSLPDHEQSMPSFKNKLKACETKTIKSSVDEPPEVELKDLPPHLEYAFLEGDNKLPVIIAKELEDEEKTALIKVLKSHKRVIAWKLPWVSPVHCVPKKGGFTVVNNEENELIPTRLVTRWRVNQPLAYQASAHQAPIPQTQSVSQTNFERYVKTNDAVLRNIQSQGQSTQNQCQNIQNQYQTVQNQLANLTDMMSKFMSSNMASSSESGTLPGNTITNPKEDLKGITTRSGVAYQGPTIPTLSKVVKQGMDECLALADLGASINLMPLSVWKELALPELTPTCMTLELADRSVSKPIDIAKDVSVKVGMFHFPADFVVVDFKPDPRVPLILGRCFLKTGHALINMHKGEITLRIGNEAITYNLDQTSRYLANYDQMTANKIDVTDEPCKEYSQEVLGFFDVTASGSPTPSNDPIISTTSPTITPFGDSDFLLFEEANAFLGLKDDPDSPELDHSYYDPEGDIQMLKAILNSDPAPSLPDHEQSVPSFKNELKACEAKTIKSSVDEHPEVELKDLPPHIEYAFLEGDNKLPVIIAKELEDEEKAALIKVLKSHKRAIAWKLSDIQGINPEFCTHKILMEEDYKPVVQHQIRVNPKIHDVIKKEVEKLLDAGLIYLISDSPWVSPVHCVPKKGGFTVVNNEENELIPTRLVTRWRVCIDYQKLKEATLKDHFPLPFMDQMLERLAGNEYYCFLDGFFGYFQIPIDPRDQEKTTFTCPYGTFAYRRMPFGLCNTPGTFQRCMLAIFHDMVEKTMEVFMDDFSVFENSFKTCHSRLDKMLQRCEDTKLCLNWEKTHFMVKEGIVVGHKISRNGIEVDKAKVNVITKLPHPTTVKGAENLAADHLSRLENPYENVLDPKEINETFPLETLSTGIDFMGPFPSSRGNKYILMAVDYLSKWVEPKALPTNDARVVCKFLKYLFARFGTPRAIISDHGTHFCNDQFAKVMRKYEVTHRLSIVYHPQTSGQVEVSNRSLKRILERTIGQNRASWSDKLDDAL
nr:DNA-directed DNA polymerase [Tanacetum cinerariifolium]